MKKRFIVFLTVIGMLFSGVNLVKADSGWDSSYDSGGSWDSGEAGIQVAGTLVGILTVVGVLEVLIHLVAVILMGMDLLL